MSLHRLTALIFSVTFLASLSTVNYFNNFYAKSAMASDAEQLLYQFHDALLDTHNILNSLPDPELFQCTEETVEQLAKLAYENPVIRLIGVFHNNEESCASEPVHFDLSDYHERIVQKNNHQLSNDLALATVRQGDGHLDFLMVRYHGNSRYFASINPFMINYLTEFACKDCLEYDFIIDGLPKLEFKSRNMNGKTSVEYSSFRHEETVKVQLFLRGTEAFYEYYKELGWISTLGFALVFSSVIAFSAYKLLTIRQSLERVIKDALRFSEFVPFYQPIVDCRNGEVIGAEVLVRWRRSDGSITPPYQFIPFAEDSGLIIDITEQLLEKVCADINALQWTSGRQFMSVNIVPEHIKNDDLFELTQSLLSKHKVPAAALSLEITERMQIDNLKLARENLDKFYQLGIELKLDDAGTGYGGFSYIQELGISTLKIDKMFVDTINRDDLKGSVLDGIISFATSSQLKMIAEGVEESYQVDYLKEHGVFYIQGYVYAKPMPLDEFKAWLEQRV